MNNKYHIVFNSDERRIMINSLNNLRNALISKGRYTDMVDELIIKIVQAKIKKFKVKEI
ncbi:MAG: hypothetical protein J1E56_00660 [Ruminococcus sp.]|nr:hypothetical protein [Ruminococcus sp.]